MRDPLSQDREVGDLWWHIILAAYPAIKDRYPDASEDGFGEAYAHLSEAMGWLSGCLAEKGRAAGHMELIQELAKEGPGKYVLEIVDLSKTPASTRIH